MLQYKVKFVIIILLNEFIPYLYKIQSSGFKIATDEASSAFPPFYLNVNHNETKLLFKDPFKSYDANTHNTNIQFSKVNPLPNEKIVNIAPNIVEAAALDKEIDVRKLERPEVLKRRIKEVLVLKYIEEDLNFNLGHEVQEWAHIMHSGTEYFIGRRYTDLVVIGKSTDNYEIFQYINPEQYITYLETYSFWNAKEQQQEGLILIACKDSVLFYRVNKSTGNIELYWQWLVGNIISGLTYFAVQLNEYLVISLNKTSTENPHTLNIYQFDLMVKEFWIAQQMQLQYPCKDVTVLDTGRDIILAVPQSSYAAVFTFNPRTDDTNNIRFQLLKLVPSKNIQFISAFQMSGRSYLALGGLQPQILLYHQGQLISKTILGNNFGLVELFVPIPSRTYRDDLILLVQHRIDFGSHSLIVLETLLWDGESFEASIPVPCMLGEYTVYGVNCMLDLQREEGLKGAALLRRGDEVSILVPRHEAESGLFKLHTKLLAKNSEVLDLQYIFDFLQEWVKEQDALIAKASELSNVHEKYIEPLVNVSNFTTLRVFGFFYNGYVEKFFLNNVLWRNEESFIGVEYVIKKVQDFKTEMNLKRHKRQTRTQKLAIEMVQITTVNVHKLLIKQINTEEPFINYNCDFNGQLYLDNLNVFYNKKNNDLNTYNITNIQFKKINNIDWGKQAEKILLKTIEIGVPLLHIFGNILFNKKINASIVNAVQFPQEFLWSGSYKPCIIYTAKEFVSLTTVNAMNSNGNVNKHHPLETITLTNKQIWTGLPTFINIKIVEQFQLDGNVRSLSNFKCFLINPLEKYANFMTINFNFENLAVEHFIFVKEHIENKLFLKSLASIIPVPMNPKDEVIVSFQKKISCVTFPMELRTVVKTICGLFPEKFVTRFLNQLLDVSILRGYTFFNELELSGFYDRIKLEDLIQDSININNHHIFVDTYLNFVGNIQMLYLHVVHGLNLKQIKKSYLTIYDKIIGSGIYFLKLNATSYFSAISPKVVFNSLSSLRVNNFILEEGIETDKLSGQTFREVLYLLEKPNKLLEIINDRNIDVNYITVTKHIHINTVNNKIFDEDIQLHMIWLNRPNFLSTDLKFVNSLYFINDVHTKDEFNNENLPQILLDSFFFNLNGIVHSYTKKKFRQNIKVLMNAAIDLINLKPFPVYARKDMRNSFKLIFHVNGNMSVGTIQSFRSNHEPVANLISAIYFDNILQMFVCLDTIPFVSKTEIVDLTVSGKLNQFFNLMSLFWELVYRNDVHFMKGCYYFNGRLTIEEGAFVSFLNTYKLLHWLKKVVFVNTLIPFSINTVIRFKTKVTIYHLQVKEGITLKDNSNCFVKEWSDSFPKMNIFTICSKSMKGVILNCVNLNQYEFNSIITLFSKQNYTRNILLSHVYLEGDIFFKDSLNVNALYQEYENTLVTHGYQHLSLPLILESVTVQRNLQINTFVRLRKGLQEAAFLRKPVDLWSPLYIMNVVAYHLQTKDFICGNWTNKHKELV